ncbi:ATP-dependent zinc metalloprotease FtsH [Candidatus Fermentibacteria bacterium]|nr:ATP-dependent zinc metalloprotease FtsH [Candidatus Fermentibacteria bacterium]
MLITLNVLGVGRPTAPQVDYSQFKGELRRDNVTRVTFEGTDLIAQLRQRTTFVVEGKSVEADRIVCTVPFEDPTLVAELESRDVAIRAKQPSMGLAQLILANLPFVLLAAAFLFLMRQMQGGTSKAFSFGKSRARLVSGDKPAITFADVAGAYEAKQELQEIVDFLKDPQRFRRLGGRIPKGALLLGPPGTGKTLLARAVAGEAGVSFFSMSGSDFVEMFVGVGASRVRDLFDQGKRHAPCIIFIDEIDAVGRHRGAGLGGGHDEREQTLNQLLVEMDGFESNDGVILLAATNRPDVLDPALLRPGRFDRQIVVDRPDVEERRLILEVHVKEVPLGLGVDLATIARGTPGMAGADLANLVNEAALLAARRGKDEVSMAELEDSKDKIMMGMERRSMIITDEEKRAIAYHEAGHVLVAKMIPGSDPIHKVTIIPRGRALGVTHYLPLDERHTYSRRYCLDTLAVMLGGRAADILVEGQPTTGAGDDIQRATELARRMVCEWGMSDRLGPLTFGERAEPVFLGRDIVTHQMYSQETALAIDAEIKTIVDDAFNRAKTILSEHMDRLDAIAAALLEREILDSNEIDRVLQEHPAASSGDGGFTPGSHASNSA